MVSSLKELVSVLNTGDRLKRLPNKSMSVLPLVTKLCTNYCINTPTIDNGDVIPSKELSVEILTVNPNSTRIICSAIRKETVILSCRV